MLLTWPVSPNNVVADRCICKVRLTSSVRTIRLGATSHREGRKVFKYWETVDYIFVFTLVVWVVNNENIWNLQHSPGGHAESMPWIKAKKVYFRSFWVSGALKKVLDFVHSWDKVKLSHFIGTFKSNVNLIARLFFFMLLACHPAQWFIPSGAASGWLQLPVLP